MKQLVLIGTFLFFVFLTYESFRAAVYFGIPDEGEYAQRTTHEELNSKELYDAKISNTDNETWKHEYVIMDKTKKTSFLNFETISDTLHHSVYKYKNN